MCDRFLIQLLRSHSVFVDGACWVCFCCRHEHQNLLSPRDGMHVRTDKTSVYNLIRKSLGGTESEPMSTPREKSGPLPKKSLLRGRLNSRRLHQAGQRAQHTTNELSWPPRPAAAAGCLFIGCLTSHQHAHVSQGRVCKENLTCCHTEIEVAHQTFHLIQSQYTDTGPTSPSTDPITPGAWQGSHWSTNFEATGMTRPGKNPVASGIRTRDLPLPRRTP